jgi:hypothetical protein
LNHRFSAIIRENGVERNAGMKSQRMTLAWRRLDGQRTDILTFYARTRTRLAFASRMKQELLRTPARAVANLELPTTSDHVNDVSRAIVTTLERQGIPAVNPPMDFLMEAERWRKIMWIVSHKPAPVAAVS